MSKTVGKISNKPRMATPRHGVAETWWYERPGSIEVVIRLHNGLSGIARIKRAALKDWLERSEPKR